MYTSLRLNPKTDLLCLVIACKWRPALTWIDEPYIDALWDETSCIAAHPEVSQNEVLWDTCSFEEVNYRATSGLLDRVKVQGNSSDTADSAYSATR